PTARGEARPPTRLPRWPPAAPPAGPATAGAALDEYLEILRRDRNWNDGAARQQLLTLFEALGAADPVVKSGRRKLSNLLFS
ncbi:MAG: tetratricopeptide repeat protein, partial [Alphaproteobacteria bacterium]